MDSDDDQQTVETIAHHFKEIFHQIEVGELSQTYLKTLALLISARFGCVALVTYLLADIGDPEIDVSHDNHCVLRMPSRYVSGDVAPSFVFMDR
jgi:hypothetical protein